MPKGQQRSNREKKKPKAAKAAAAANTAQPSQMKGSFSPLNLPKKKG